MPSGNNVVSLSGGKDSTAMLHYMIDRGENIHSVVFLDTGWEFPAMLDHIDLVEQKTGIGIVGLQPKKSFHYRMTAGPVIARKGPRKGQVHRFGNGWPSWSRRWCTGVKIGAIAQYFNRIENPVDCIGFAADESHRCDGASLKARKWTIRYPLVEYGKTEADCLQYCRSLGYNWDGLYNIFDRVSCFCCPFQKVSELRKLRKHFPDLWARMLKWEDEMPDNRGFKNYTTVHDYEKRFSPEDLQLRLF